MIPCLKGEVRGRRVRLGRVLFRPRLEALEVRDLLAVVSVDAGQVLRPVSDQMVGVNLAWWEQNLSNPQTLRMVQNAGLTLFRIPGGSSTDQWHFNVPNNFYLGEQTVPEMASFVEAAHGEGMATVDYGSGSPQEAAAYLAYLDGSVSNTTSIGLGEEYDASSGSWVEEDWQTAGYWANLRASAPLAQDDGLNFLRVDHPGPFNFPYFEVGNEEYGSWETDNHGQGGDLGKPHDPATYVAFAKQFAGYAAQIAPNISIGLDTGSVSDYNNWISNVLQQCAIQGYTPGFLSDHSYIQGPGYENDSTLLQSVSNPSNATAWATRAAGYRGLLQQYLGSAAGSVELLATEFNSVPSNPGKQSTSLVNGLFVADSLGSLLDTEYNGSAVWDLSEAYNTGGNNSSSLYGWRQGGDYGLIGSNGSGPTPATGTDVPYPDYFAEQLVSKMVHGGGGNVVQASSNDPNLSVYAVRESNGHLDLLVINKNPTADITGQFQVAGFAPASQAQVWQYGKAQDTAQSQTADGYAALANFSATLGLAGSNFSYTFPSYSMTVLDMGESSPGSDPVTTIQTPASATPNGTSASLSVLAADSVYSPSQLTYTWAVSSMPPGASAPTFSSNGANAAQNVTATFSSAGSYTFQVTAEDPAFVTAVSSVTVMVGQNVKAGASFVGTDATTQGHWRTAYGGDGYDIEGDSSATNPSLPSYASVSVTGASTYTWGTNTSSPLALQNAAANGDIAATWFSTTSFNINVNVLDGKSHLVTLYALDWDQLKSWNVPRSERIDIVDAATGTVLDTRTLSSFQGEYISWNIQGNVIIRVTNLVAGNNAVVSGLFFGAAASTSSNSAAFVGTDATTQGHWHGVYGANGYDIEGDSSATNPNLPSYATVSITGNYTYTWGTNTGNPYALQNAAANGDIAATWFSTTSFNINVNVLDGKSHLVTLYALDWDQLKSWNVPRSERIDIVDAATGTVLDTRTLSSFQGEYISWNIQGNVIIRVTNLVAGNNAIVSGLFFG